MASDNRQATQRVEFHQVVERLEAIEGMPAGAARAMAAYAIVNLWRRAAIVQSKPLERELRGFVHMLEQVPTTCPEDYELLATAKTLREILGRPNVLLWQSGGKLQVLETRNQVDHDDLVLVQVTAIVDKARPHKRRPPGLYQLLRPVLRLLGHKKSRHSMKSLESETSKALARLVGALVMPRDPEAEPARGPQPIADLDTVREHLSTMRKQLLEDYESLAQRLELHGTEITLPPGTELPPVLKA